jgi:hypothetical protein
VQVPLFSAKCVYYEVKVNAIGSVNDLMYFGFGLAHHPTSKALSEQGTPPGW